MVAMAHTLRADTTIRATTVPALLGFIRESGGGAPVTMAAATTAGAVSAAIDSSPYTGSSRNAGVAAEPRRPLL